MTRQDVAGWLRDRAAQHDVVSWAEPFGADWPAAWEACPRGDWLLGIAARAGVPATLVGRAALEVARFGLEDVAPDALPIPDALARAPSVLAARDAAGLATLRTEADVFERASDAAGDPALAASLLAAACALRACARPEEAASVPALVAQAAVLSAGDCAMTAAFGYAQRRSAEIVRGSIPAQEILSRLQP